MKFTKDSPSDLEKRVGRLEETTAAGDEVGTAEWEPTENQESAIDALVDELNEEERALAAAIDEYAAGVDDPMFRGEGGAGCVTQAGADFLEIVCNPEFSMGDIDRERYEEYL